MSLHAFPAPAPRPADPPVGEREKPSVPNGGDSGPNLHILQMEHTLLAAEAAGRALSTNQLRIIWQQARAFYYHCAAYYSLSDPPCFDTAAREVQLAYLSATAELLRDFPPTRCAICGGPADDGELYCSKSCAIRAEMD